MGMALMVEAVATLSVGRQPSVEACGEVVGVAAIVGGGEAVGVGDAAGGEDVMAAGIADWVVAGGEEGGDAVVPGTGMGMGTSGLEGLVVTSPEPSSGR